MGSTRLRLDLLGRIAEKVVNSQREVLSTSPWVGRTLRALREACVISQANLGCGPADLAARAGTTRATISQSESGVNANPAWTSWRDWPQPYNAVQANWYLAGEPYADPAARQSARVR